ncbi:MAG: ArgE/DapE family deacylase [Anaerolineae bacterium]|nr:ArgE/DapE family deacylase [Anaerolineae bacterium]
MTELSQLLSQLVAINSINPDLVPKGAGEYEIAQFVATWCRQHGLEVHIEEAAPHRPNVIAIARGTGGGKSLMLNAHMDVVGVAGMQRPFDPTIEDGKLYGRGAFDMKGSLAASMLVTARAKELGLAGDVILTAVVDEEYASIGTSTVMKSGWKADACIVTEPTAMELCVAHKGFAWIDVETFGVAAHGSQPQTGVDAITKMGHVLVELDKLNQRLLGSKRHKLLGTGSLHASLISGGQELSSYPAHTKLQVERRTIPGETQEQVNEQIQQILRFLTLDDPSFKAKAEITLMRDSFEIAETAPIVKTLKQSVQQVRGAAPTIAGASFWMDSALTSAAGIPTVIFGPSGDGAHAEIEWVDLATVEQCVEIYLAAAKAFCV